MNITTNQLITYVLTLIITIIGGYFTKEVSKLVPNIIAFVQAHIGLTNYQKVKLIAQDIWNVVEEHFRVNELISDTVQSKITIFETLIKQKVPGITDQEIELVRQAIAGEFNKDKPIVLKAIQEPVVTVATPIVKYFATDGTELTPLIASITALPVQPVLTVTDTATVAPIV